MHRCSIIYGLYYNSELRYIGRTTQQPLMLRLKQHIRVSAKNKSHLSSWIRSVDPDMIEIKELDSCNIEVSRVLEAKHISKHLELGCRLVNSMKPKNNEGLLCHSDETKERIGEATKKVHTGMKRSLKTRKKISEAAKKRVNNASHLQSSEVRAKMEKNRHKRKVSQYDKEMNFIKNWESITSAAKALKLSKGNICMCCKGNVKTVGGFIWKYRTRQGS